MSEMIERIQRAIAPMIQASGPIYGYDSQAMVRAALEAMREPTEEMCRAGGENIFNERMGAFPEKDAEEAANIFRTMINEALK